MLINVIYEHDKFYPQMSCMKKFYNLEPVFIPNMSLKAIVLVKFNQHLRSILSTPEQEVVIVSYYDHCVKHWSIVIHLQKFALKGNSSYTIILKQSDKKCCQVTLYVQKQLKQIDGRQRAWFIVAKATLNNYSSYEIYDRMGLKIVGHSRHQHPSKTLISLRICPV